MFLGILDVLEFSSRFCESRVFDLFGVYVGVYYLFVGGLG